MNRNETRHSHFLSVMKCSKLMQFFIDMFCLKKVKKINLLAPTQAITTHKSTNKHKKKQTRRRTQYFVFQVFDVWCASSKVPPSRLSDHHQGVYFRHKAIIVTRCALGLLCTYFLGWFLERDTFDAIRIVSNYEDVLSTRQSCSIKMS